jgi:hypothetical protein
VSAEVWEWWIVMSADMQMKKDSYFLHCDVLLLSLGEQMLCLSCLEVDLFLLFMLSATLLSVHPKAMIWQDAYTGAALWPS